MFPFLAPGDLPQPEIEDTSLESPALAGVFFTTKPPGKPKIQGKGVNPGLSSKQ